jgi:hypothetical protein
LKEYFDYLKDINSENLIIEKFIGALGCHSEVGIHLGKVGFELMKKIREELMKPLYPVIRMKPASMSGIVYGGLMKELTVVIDFSQFEAFCIQRFGLTGDYKSYVVRMMNHEIFGDYSSRTDALSPELSLEEHTQKSGEIYADAIRNIKKLCLELVEKWTLFHNSDVNWTYDETGFFHIPSQTYHGTLSDSRPYYLGISVLIEEASSVSLPSKGKKRKGKPEREPVPEEKPEREPVPEEKPEREPVPEEKPQANPVLEEKPQGTPVHVFMNCKSGVVFTVPE